MKGNPCLPCASEDEQGNCNVECTRFCRRGAFLRSHRPRSFQVPHRIRCLLSSLRGLPTTQRRLNFPCNLSKYPLSGLVRQPCPPKQRQTLVGRRHPGHVNPRRPRVERPRTTSTVRSDSRISSRPGKYGCPGFWWTLCCVGLCVECFHTPPGTHPATPRRLYPSCPSASSRWCFSAEASTTRVTCKVPAAGVGHATCVTLCAMSAGRGKLPRSTDVLTRLSTRPCPRQTTTAVVFGRAGACDQLCTGLWWTVCCSGRLGSLILCPSQ